MIIYDAAQIKATLNLQLDLPFMMRAIRDELVSFSNGNFVTGMPLHLDFLEENGDCHIKAGYNKNDEIFIIKVATGFYGNKTIGLPAGDGLMLIVCKNTGLIQSILCDAGYLTTLRTAITVCLAATLTPWQTNRVSIIGTGELAQLIIALIHQLHPKTSIHIWGRDQEKIKQIQVKYPYVYSEKNLSTLIFHGGIICTTTASKSPIIYPHDLSKRVHIIAVGADQPGKQEIDAAVFSMADHVIVDSKERASRYGDSAIALKNGHIISSNLIEIGQAFHAKIHQNAQTIVTDLAGIAPQDIGIAKYALQCLTHDMILP